ncbi:MAG: hypothetical protein CBC13_01385 [Planctomycetia bacterium TMED53]|nr:MAG: hypothetical protein CBC13_01385 [Planctomycetia bacterium TMED53]
MTTFVLLLLVPSLLLSENDPAHLNLQVLPEWQELTPPEDLSGWKICCGPAQYSVKDGVVTGTTVPGSPNTFLVTEKTWGDFDLEYEFKVDSKLNAGVQIRSEVIDGRMRGCQIEIDMDEDRQRFWSAGIYEEGDRGWLSDLSNNPEAIAAHNIDDWNHVRVVTRGAMIETFLNGVPAAKTRCGQRLKGVIGLQVHGVGSNQTEPLQVQWKNIRIRDHGEHHWITWLTSSENDTTPPSQGTGSKENPWKIELPASVDSLQVTLELKGGEFWNFRSGIGAFHSSADRRSWSYLVQGKSISLRGSSPSMGSNKQWKDVQIFLYAGDWGHGYEFIPKDREGSSRRFVHHRKKVLSPAREAEISATPGATWKVQALVPKTTK